MRYTMDFSLFSILISVYNMEKYIGKCIYSVLEQTYPNFEVIIIDAGSTDDSGKICDRYAQLDDRIKVYHQARQGIGKVRRNAVERACGDYYLFLNGNDYWECDLLETLSRTIWNYNCDLMIFNDKNAGAEGKVSGNPIFEDGSLFDRYNKSRIFEAILNGNQLNKLHTFAVKNTIIHSSDKQISQMKMDGDHAYILPFIFKANRIIYLDKPMYNYRVLPQRMTKKVYFNRISDTVKVHKLLLRYLELLNMCDKKHLEQFYNSFMKLVLGYISELSISRINYIQKRKMLNKIQNISLYQNGTVYMDKSAFTANEKILLYLMKQKYYDLVILNEQKNKIVYFLLYKIYKKIEDI
ncbi:glycosyltransferase involved in cell wall biosynthesis [Mobilisporobacter senegalensis]|uniref:Glycosyltransferase involved in cell wall biosynthesis n=1 Tax=Mobilisporobacter senegalensis TaxID=1329262 RepID=A0A3N1XKX8_9FIRM|nr:glycosyltransferase family A protein [Mobilisporobacter senegalensis]ROR27369.1 glycosyltransferase involved in cell wall biosynthesis [Mobilisporobacter senegalensis]